MERFFRDFSDALCIIYELNPCSFLSLIIMSFNAKIVIMLNMSKFVKRVLQCLNRLNYEKKGNGLGNP